MILYQLFFTFSSNNVVAVVIKLMLLFKLMNSFKFLKLTLNIYEPRSEKTGLQGF